MNKEIEAVAKNFKLASLKELLFPLGWGLITWAIATDNIRLWAASAGIFLFVYVALAAYGQALIRKQGNGRN